MQIRVSDIPDEGLQILSSAGLESVYPDPGFHLEGVALSVVRRGEAVEVTGGFEATARFLCGRCLEPLTCRVAPGVALRLMPAPTDRQGGQVELGADDLEVDFYRADTLDIDALLRSETDLALPMKPLCGPDCRGLCPVCGGNRNVTPCRCEARGTDPRLAPLEALRRLQ